jgi:hypothetical protein
MLNAETFLAFSLQPLALVWFPPSAFRIWPFLARRPALENSAKLHPSTTPAQIAFDASEVFS